MFRIAVHTASSLRYANRGECHPRLVTKLVGHSFGGAMLLKYLSEETIKASVASLFLIAAPFVGADENWRDNAFALEPDFAGKLSGLPQISLYHSRDDDIVPFAHLAVYARSLPQATVRKFRSRGHHFGNDL